MASSMMERMKKSRGQSAAVIQSAVSASSGGFTKDERIWKYGYIDSGKKDSKTGKAIMYSDTLIRFLPTPFIDIRKQDENLIPAEAVLSPVVLLCRHEFKGADGARYSELALKTIGQDCPVNEHDRPLWEKWKEDGKPDDQTKKILVGRLPKDEYYANILVIDDKAKPENNGKVFLFKFSAAIKNMIDQAFDPSLPTSPTYDPFDPFDGADLHLTFMGEERSFNGWTGLVPVDMGKMSTWKNSPMCGGDEAEIESKLELAYSLQDFIKPELFKTYDQLKERLMTVLGVNAVSNEHTPETSGVSVKQEVAPKTEVHQTTAAAPAVKAEETADDSDDLDEFEKLLMGA